jgi:hypothetical protein
MAVRKSTLVHLEGLGMQVPDQSYSSHWMAQLPQRRQGKQKRVWASKNWWSAGGARQERVRNLLIQTGRAAAARSVDARTLKCVVFHSGCRRGQAVAPSADHIGMRKHLRTDFGKVKALCKFCRRLWWKQYS